MQYTDEQYAAIYTHDTNLIVMAGAGSGKTRVLVDRFVALLEANPDWPLTSLVAITFTEKAAREMRDRVRQAIEDRIVKATETGDRAEITRWRDRQAALDSARIGTIHSLCTSILRANAAGVGVDPGFEVLDEVEAAILLGEAMEQALTDLADVRIGDLTLLSIYDLAAVKGLLPWLIRETVISPPDADTYRQQWAELLPAIVEEYLTELRQNTQFVDALCLSPQVSHDDKIMQLYLEVIRGRDVLLAPETPVTDCLAILQRYQAFKLIGGSAKAWGGKETFDQAKANLTLIRDTAKAILQAVKPLDEHDDLAADLLMLWQQVALHTKGLYADLKKQRRVLDFDDLETLTQKLLREQEVKQRYQGGEFRQILVDEFQDTNRAQRDIIYALAGKERPGSLFIVGDPKQSIYQFRGADVSVFESVRADILQTNGLEIALSTSFRTHTKLIDGFNSIFSQLLIRGTGPMSGYQVPMDKPMTAVRPAMEHHSPCLELLVIDKQAADPNQDSADALRQWEAWELARRIHQMVEAGKPVWDRATDDYRPMHYGDVAVLFQASKGMPLVEEAFKAADIPYVTMGGKGYYSRPEVWDLLNLLKALYNPADNLSLATALRSPLFSLSDDDLYALRLQRGANGKRLPLWSALMDEQRQYNPPPPNTDAITFARQVLRRLFAAAGRVTIAELLTRTLDETAYLPCLSSLPDGARRCGNVEKLIEVARRSNRVALGEFTAYLQDMTERETREGEAIVATQDMVQLMTVHASKGLEFPVVALFDAAWDAGSHKPTLLNDPLLGLTCRYPTADNEWIDPFAYRIAEDYDSQRDEAERLRLLYVAMTRAQDYLIISGRSTAKARSWLARLLEVLQLPETLEAPNEEQIFSYPWGDCLLRIPRTPPSLYVPPRSESSAWDELDLEPEAPVYQPPLLNTPPRDPYAPARTLSVAEIALLGDLRASNDDTAFKTHVLQNVPSTILDRKNAPDDLMPSIIGKMVHQALRWWRLPSTTPALPNMLDSYAWEHGLTDPQEIQEAIEQALDLLRRTERSSIITQINQASQVYRELPFTVRLGDRMVNGIIDVLFFSKYQHWTVVDYKTSHVGDPAYIHAHAARYYTQIGVYAAAVEAMTGQIPDSHLHYIRYVQTVKVEPSVWQPIIQRLDSEILAALGNGEAK